MKVADQDQTPETLDRVAAESRMNELYRNHWRSLNYFIYERMDDRHRSVAEDLAAETYTVLWAKYLARGKEIWGPWTLLTTIARTVIADFYKVKANQYREMTVDFSDPANRGIERGHSYATTQPEAAMVAEELTVAMDRMTEASKQWRDQHAETHRFRVLLTSTLRQPLTPVTRAKTQGLLAMAEAEEADFLETFRKACARVGQLRIELEEAGGPNWCSSTGHPPTAARNWYKGKGHMQDPNRTHCDAGHALTLANTHFSERGQRRCRACITAAQQVGAPADRPKFGGKPPVSEEAVGQARELLKDPKLSLTKIAKQVGISRSTLVERIPDIDQLRDRSVLRNDPVPQHVLDRACELAADPSMRIKDIAAAVGISVFTLYNRIPDLTERRNAAKAAAIYRQNALTGAGTK